MAKQIILDWAQHVTASYPSVRISDFSASFADGFAFAAIVHHHNPELLPCTDSDNSDVRSFEQTMSRMSRLDRLDWAFTSAEDLGVERYLEPEDIHERRPDDKSVLLYMSQMYKYYNGQLGKVSNRRAKTAGGSNSGGGGGSDSIDALIAAAEKKRLQGVGGGVGKTPTTTTTATTTPTKATTAYASSTTTTSTTSSSSSAAAATPKRTYGGSTTTTSTSTSTTSTSTLTSSTSSSSSAYGPPPVKQNLWSTKKEEDSDVDHRLSSATRNLSISSSPSPSSSSSSSTTGGGSVGGVVQGSGPVFTDAVPIVVDPSTRRRRRGGAGGAVADSSYGEIVSNVFIGDDFVAHNLEKLQSIGITHVLCLSESGYYNAEPFPSQFTYKTWSVQDKAKFELYDLFDVIADYVLAIRKRDPSRNKVLVYCKSGVSLAPTAMIAYLMREHQMTLDTAMSRVTTKWPKTKPNSGFMEQLNDFDLDMEDDAADAGILRV